MTKIKDILDPDKLIEMYKEKRIAKQVHPTLPLYILNYTNRAQFANKWTLEERVCRGLIADFDGNVIARGPSKFFNYGQPGAPEVALDEPVWVTRKEDGSLGIGWTYDGHFGVATRGSFASDQAIHATALLTDKQKQEILSENDKGRTPIWEIVYPENHIVLHYGGRDELITLGGVQIETGLITKRPMGLFMSVTLGGNPRMTFADALALPIPDDEEGYVIDVLTEDNFMRGHIKLKGDRYKELHAATFKLTERSVWESFVRDVEAGYTGEIMDEFIADLPDEVQPWVETVYKDLRDEFRAVWRLLEESMVAAHIRFLDDGLENPKIRGDVARFFKENFPNYTGPLFSLLDNRTKAVDDWVLKQIRPEHKPFRVEDENAN